MGIRDLMQEGCREEGNRRECVWLSKYIGKDEAYLELINDRTYSILAVDEDGEEAPLAVFDVEIHVLKLTKDRHLLFYIKRNKPLRLPKERIWHYVLTEEGAEVVRRKMAAVKTIEEFWALVREVEKAAEKFGEFWELVVEEAKRRGMLSISGFEELVKELREEVGYCSGGGICIEDDAARYYVYNIEDEYLYPPDDS
jgi:hypothetical protein